MIIKGKHGPIPGRVAYDFNGFSLDLKHFVVRETTPDNPFVPHSHEKREMWYMISGAGFFHRDGIEEPVSGGDLIRIDPWVKHGLRTEDRINWICLG